MRVLLWHVHGSWTTSFVQGDHDYLLPMDAVRGPDGRGRARTWDWPRRAVEIPVESLRDTDVDVVLLQRPHEIALCQHWLGRRAGTDVRALYLEHNTPGQGAVTTRHPLADRDDIPVVHVTHFNRLVWDTGRAPTTVIEHGIIDPGRRYGGEVPRAAVVVNEPVRRGRTVGTDLVLQLAGHAPVDVFGMQVDALHDVHALLPPPADIAADAGRRVPPADIAADAETGLPHVDIARNLGGRVPPGRLRTYPDVPQADLHAELSRRRVYVHTHRWTSLGLSLLEAMHLGMPVVVIATTEAATEIPAAAGCVTTRPEDMFAAVRRLLADPLAAHEAGVVAREFALSRYGLDRFLADWDAVLAAT